jgi:membrane protease YdiL (CAAX protease family)
MTPDERTERRAWLTVGLFISLGIVPLIWVLDEATWDRLSESWRERIGQHNYTDLLHLIVALLIVIANPQSSGLGPGHFGRHWKLLSLLMIVPPAIAAIVIPRLPERPFAGHEIGAWLLSPVAEELLFTGFLFGQLIRHFPNPISPRLRVPVAVILTAAFFSLHHVWNLTSSKMSVNYAVFQLSYTFVGGLIHALIRYWSGSIWYAVLVHMAVNWIAVQG